jgi:hypothetical protein
MSDESRKLQELHERAGLTAVPISRQAVEELSTRADAEGWSAERKQAAFEALLASARDVHEGVTDSTDKPAA